MTFWHWLVVAAVFVVLELMSVSFFFWFWALAALGMALLVGLFPELLAWQGQALWFAVLATLSVLLWRKHMKKWQKPNDTADLLTHRGRMLLHKRFVLQTAIENGRGRLQVGDTLWQLDSVVANVAAGTLIEVIGDADGHLQVKVVEHA